MNSKEILSNKELHIKMLKGIKTLRKTVSSTMGANGKYVIIEGSDGTSRITKDGVSVAYEIKFDDKFENMAAKTIIDASISTVEDIGDGTSTTALLSSWIYELAVSDDVKKQNFFVRFMNIKQKQKNYKHVTESIKRDMDIVIGLIDNYKKEVTNENELISVATVSANNDKTIGNIVGSLWHLVGKNGIVELSRSQSGETYSQTSDGLIIGAGYYSKMFTNIGNKSVLTDCYILTTNHNINSANDIMPILQHVANSDHKKIFILANSFSNDFVSSMLSNKKNGIFDSCLVETPKVGNWAGIDIDLSVYTGGKFADISELTKLSDLDITHLGFAKSVTTTLNKTTIIVDSKSSEHNNWITNLELDIDERKTESYKERLRERIARLDGKIATIYIGGETETEHNYLYDMYDDSVKATKHCLTSGITIGGGTIYAKISQSLPKDSILGMALKKPLEQLLINSDFDQMYISNVINNILEEKRDGYGYNLLTDNIENLYDSGIIEPIGLIKSCIKNSCSVANLLINIHSGIAIIPEQLI
jgi:chaperonin GroEL